MRINLEKPKSSAKTTLSVEAGLPTKKITRERKPAKKKDSNVITPTEAAILDQAAAITTPKRRRVKSEGLNMAPDDRRTDLDHTKKSIRKPYWKTPEDLPVAPVADLDNLTPKDIIGKPEKIPYQDNEHERLMKEFGTINPSEIDAILAREYQLVTEPLAPATDPEYEQGIHSEMYTDHAITHEVPAEILTTPIEEFETKQPQEARATQRIHANPHKSHEKIRKISREHGTRNLGMMNSSKKERASRGWLRNWFHGLLNRVEDEIDDDIINDDQNRAA